LVVALRGDWGSGKTSIKNLVVEALTPPDATPMKVVTFNPWQWGSDEAITLAFFREIAAALGDAEQSLPVRRRAQEFRRYAKVLEQFSGSAKKPAAEFPGSLRGSVVLD
jgi:predicted KAP-like P-loop ATPase